MRNAKLATWMFSAIGTFLIVLATIGTCDYFFNAKSHYGGEVIGAWMAGLLLLIVSCIVRFCIEEEESK